MSTAEEEKKEIIILESHRHILYLPLHWAVVKNECYGLLPKQCTVKMHSIQNYGDDDIYKRMMIGTEGQIVITDPAIIFTTTFPDKKSWGGSKPVAPVVLAAVVTDSAFWLVNNKSNEGEDGNKQNEGKISPHLTEVAKNFTVVISSEPGSTSNRIAEKIRSRASSIKVEPVPQGKEIRSMKIHGDKAIALTPNILEIVQKQELEKRLAISYTGEFLGVISSALISRSDFVENEKDIVGGIVRSVKMAIDEINVIIGDEINVLGEDKKIALLDFMVNHYGCKNRNEAQGVLEIMSKYKTIPSEICIEHACWMRTAKQYFDVEGKGKKTAAQIDEDGERYFKLCIEKYSHIAKDAKNFTAKTSNGERPTGVIVPTVTNNVEPPADDNTPAIPDTESSWKESLTPPNLMNWLFLMFFAVVVLGLIATFLHSISGELPDNFVIKSLYGNDKMSNIDYISRLCVFTITTIVTSVACIAFSNKWLNSVVAPVWCGLWKLLGYIANVITVKDGFFK
ncbi:hypothetical protein FACS1894139_02330 [Planctomycetales bacterium]|nr:hypothetical protein FACS1894107_15720 [Planctomycetales bacterium]GHS96386.1 hypothetical protein FACS1894108_00910 [Planctomycetales bacterium]GHT03019.1 hypothetical protein FACS1894139_02330 [Planctomycetales bacterium]